MNQDIQAKCLTLKFLNVALITVLISANATAQSNRFVLNNGANPLKSLVVESGRESHPFFVDIDKDGDMDCFSGEFNYNNKGDVVSKIYFFKNEGTTAYPLFKHVTGTDNPLSKVTVAGLTTPYFIDIDNDNDYDCFIGDNSGALRFYKNAGSAATPVFEKQSAANNPLRMVKFADFESAEPSFTDIDGDRDYDCLVADRYGNENYFKNIGSAENASFKKVTVRNEDPFSFLGNKEVNSVSLYDWNKDGRIDLFVGNKYYKNIGASTTPLFVLTQDNAPDLTANSSYLPIRWVDLNGDGAGEIITGTASGNFDYFTSSSSVASVSMLQLKVYPNPSRDQFMLYWPGNTNAETVIRITDVQGKVVSVQKTNSNPVIFGKELKTGIYFLQVLQNGTEVFRQQLIKE